MGGGGEAGACRFSLQAETPLRVRFASHLRVNTTHGFLRVRTAQKNGRPGVLLASQVSGPLSPSSLTGVLSGGGGASHPTQASLQPPPWGRVPVATLPPPLLLCPCAEGPTSSCPQPAPQEVQAAPSCPASTDGPGG